MAKKVTAFPRPETPEEEPLHMIFEIGGKRTIIDLTTGEEKVQTHPALIPIGPKKSTRRKIRRSPNA